MTGGLRQYLLQHDQAVKGLNFRAAVPVNLRSPDDELTLGNKFGLVFLSLPVGIADPVERLFEFRRRMEKLKGSSEAIVALGVLGAIGLSPARLQDMVVDIFGAKATCVMTNVPGPQQTLYLSGAPIRSMMFWVPQSGRLGMGISLLSYDGEVRLGVATDAGLVPDPEAIIDGFQQEFDVLKGMAQLSEKQNSVEPKEHYNG
jgi:WS/DGAT/MGAT family acyltransferase